MQLKVTRSSCLGEDDEHTFTIDIESIRDLIKLSEQEGNEIILTNKSGNWGLEIYDYYRE